MLKNENGNIMISILITVLATASALVFPMIAQRDVTFSLYQLDSVQQLHLVRSEMLRGFMNAQRLSESIDSETLPIRKIEINNGISVGTVALKTSIFRTVKKSYILSRNLRKVLTKAKSYRCDATYTDYYSDRRKSPVESCAFKSYQSVTFASYGFFTDIDESVNGDPVYYYGYDEVWGRVHSNTDIWLKNIAGWPTFHDCVTTAGQIQFVNGSPANINEIFLAGYMEHAPAIEFTRTAVGIRNNGVSMPIDFDDVDIVFADIHGTEVIIYTGEILVDENPTCLPVYNSYPPYGEIGEQIETSQVTLRDTVWSGAYSWIMHNQSTLVEAELWIKGVVGTAMCWGCTEDIRIVDDLLYQNTPAGSAPDGSDGSPLNYTDYLGLVSEGSIYVSYGYKHPATGERLHPNCGGDMFIYGALCAFGHDDPDPYNSGVFTFEYHYPHRSTPDQDGYSMIDLHLCKYPPENPLYWPWPADTEEGIGFASNRPDYPWYNPLWPEWEPYLERGTINLWGSVAQRRRGFLHRSGTDPLDSGHWDIENHFYGNLPIEGVNAPDSYGSGVGYRKNYHADYRMMENPPPDYPEVFIEGGLARLQELEFCITESPKNF